LVYQFSISRVDWAFEMTTLDELTQKLFDRRCDGCRVREGWEHKCHSITGQKEIMLKGEREFRYCECEECGVFILQAINQSYINGEKKSGNDY